MLATVHATAFESSPDLLFAAHRHPGSGALPVVAVAVAAVVFAASARTETATGRGLLAPAVDAWRGASDASFVVAVGWAAVAGAYAASLGTLELAQALWAGTTEHAFERGHVLVTGTWAV